MTGFNHAPVCPDAGPVMFISLIDTYFFPTITAGHDTYAAPFAGCTGSATDGFRQDAATRHRTASNRQHQHQSKKRSIRDFL